MYSKKYLVLMLSLLSIKTIAQEQTTDTVHTLESAEVRATRWNQQTLTPAITKIKPTEMPEINTGMDLPQTLQSVPSLIFSSDAGNNIGYTNMKIRGSDATRINVTINGVPYNDAESQGLFFVNISDILSSADDILITSGIGSSTNGSGALGASINIATGAPPEQAAAQLMLNAGSYGTSRGTLKFSTGRLAKYKAAVRLSGISSDGYIQRAGSQLGSALITQSYDLSDKHLAKLVLFTGTERTGQAWDGISVEDFEQDPTQNHLGTKEDGSYYDNQTDNYTQSHAQLFFNSQWSERLSTSLGLYTTWGRGYYEEYKVDQAYSDYGLGSVVIDTHVYTSTSLIRQLWLDNVLSGINASIEYQGNKYTNITGISTSTYRGQHYGEVIWAQQAIDNDYRWYDNTATKSEFNIYNKFFYLLPRGWTLGLDLQYRYVNYKLGGFRDNPLLTPHQTYGFFNPKLSAQKKNLSLLGGRSTLNFFVGRASKEPIRSDFESSTEMPRPESVTDVELSMNWRRDVHSIGVGLYGMFYTDQLVLTGKLNDVGAYTRQNVDQSRRMGVELSYRADWQQGWYLHSNAAISLNKISKLTVYFDQYDSDWSYTGQRSEQLSNRDISYSPNRIAFLQLGKKKTKISNSVMLHSALRVKAVSKQYLDNTQSDERMMPSYTTLDLILGLHLGKRAKTSVYFSALNLLGASYYSNGYSYGYDYDAAFVSETRVYPQARFNYNVGLKLDI